jgi:hypothetical protein
MKVLASNTDINDQHCVAELENSSLELQWLDCKIQVSTFAINEQMLVCIFIVSTLRRTWLQEYPKPPFAFKLLLLSISCSSQ